MSANKPASRGYHHGDLREAMLSAARDELADRGVEGFTLRSCARRAGVSHAAPAHHFGDVTGLLTEVAIGAFKKLAGSMQTEIEKVEHGSIDQPIAAALGYVYFAIASPAEFNLMFRTERLAQTTPELRAAGQGAFRLAAESIGAFYAAADAMSDPVLARRVVGLWSQAHGLASLLLSHQLGPLTEAKALAKSVLPDIVRESLGVPPRNDVKDLALISQSGRSTPSTT
jgi:AcrR family transcriptional regulator